MNTHELCIEVFKAIQQEHGNSTDLGSYSREERVVIIVVHAGGVIDNGGLQYLLEVGVPDDQQLNETIWAFRQIGAVHTSDAIGKLKQIFPDSRLPEAGWDRASKFHFLRESVQEALESDMIPETGGYTSLLEVFIRRHPSLLAKSKSAFIRPVVPGT